jgi:uncharacterized protein
MPFWGFFKILINMDFKPDYLDHPIYIKYYNQDLNQLAIYYQNNSSEVINTSTIILFDKVIYNWGPKDLVSLTTSSITQIISYNPEIIILGIGQKLVALAPEILAPLYQAKIPFEVMSTINACRTYNLLASEHRKVAAALII